MICEALNLPGQFYPIQVCRNRNRNAQRNQNQVNSLEAFITESNEAKNQMRMEKTKMPGKIRITNKAPC